MWCVIHIVTHNDINIVVTINDIAIINNGIATNTAAAGVTKKKQKTE